MSDAGDDQFRDAPGDAEPDRGVMQSARAAADKAEPAVDDEQIIEAFRQARQRRSNLLHGLLILGASIALFVALGFLRFDLTMLWLLIVVLAVHEAGHYLAMRAFGYRDVKVFFIPLFGAAVSGRHLTAAGYKRAIVTLAGPIPGLAIGLALGLADQVVNIPRLDYFALMFVIINALNLLPIFPLDGGRLMHELVFSRWPVVELMASLLAGAPIVVGSVLLREWLFVALGALVLITAYPQFKLARLAKRWRDYVLAVNEMGASDIDEDHVRPMIPEVRQAFPMFRRAKEFGTQLVNLWERAGTRPPGPGATIGLLAVYVGSLLSIPVLVLLTVWGADNDPQRFEYTDVEMADGTVVLREQKYGFGFLVAETDVSPDGLYHGRHVQYSFEGHVQTEGSYLNGYWHGQWKSYDADGRFVRVITYEDGQFVSAQEWTKTGWSDRELSDMDWMFRDTLRRHQKDAPHGRESRDVDLNSASETE